MVVLRSLLVVTLASCYSPDVRDCTVTCNQLADCAPGQVCGEDGFCAAQDVAGRCSTIAAPNDAGIDARSPDAPRDAAPPDAAPTVKLLVRIDGRGNVMIPTIGVCDGGSGQVTCPFDVVSGVPLTLLATPRNNWRFERWDDACAGSPTPSCELTPTANISARVRFEQDDDDDDDAL
jgi:hypothetical protein